MLARLLATQQAIAGAGVSLDDVLAVVIERAVELVDADGAAVALQEGSGIVFRAASERMRGILGVTLDMQRSLAGRCASSGQLQYAADTELNPYVDRSVSRRLGVRSVLCAPLIHQGTVIGVLNIVSHDPNHFNESAQQLMRLLTSFAGAAIELRRELAARTAVIADLDAAHEEMRDASYALGRSEALFRTITENTTEMTTAISAVGVITYASPSFERIMGYRADEMIGQNVMSFMHPDDVPRLTELMGVVAQTPGASTRTRLRMRHAHGGYRVIDGAGVNLLDNPAVNAIVSSMRDITEQVRIEESLRTSEERYRFVERATNDVIYDWDLRDDSIYWSDAMATLYGHAASVPRNLEWWKQKVHPEDLTRVLDALDASVKSGSPWFRDEYRLRRADGSYARIIDRGLFTRDETGAATHMIGAMTDVTEQRALEEQFRQAQKMDAVGQLAGGIAHDFNNLLTVVKLHTELLLEQIPEGDDKHEDLLEVRRASNRAAALTRQLLAFSRKQIMQPRPVDANMVVREIEEMLRRLIGEDIHLQALLTEPLPAVLADPGQLEQVLMNLVVNARDAMPQGGTVTIETARVAATGEALARDPGALRAPHVRLTVRDTGHGMTPEVRARIFEPFFTTKPPGQGTGLGLSTAYGIVRQSGGFITVDSTPNEGTAFHVFLPTVDAPASVLTPAAGTPSVEAAKPSAGVVLLVEDEDALRALAERVLVRQGYKVYAAANADAAEQLVDAHAGEIDLILSDAVMPGRSGPELVAAITPRCPRAAVIFMSGYTESDIVRRGLETTKTVFIQKPFTVQGLLDAVKQAVHPA